ncbi:hypothetical protein PpBr36_05562 [Pyricularia pennisetigena]|uniref:hypothetical protein n=1 Tax=Pyricularia pennisetigena TaxID=1578925 RepID=UPI001152A12D|nr:hypothetical protein PpBr36_05562 [Pyricularia pennisetigena]TLS27180.1 hypothetical protein PpBr36_05562 [Pyricularia pennisetigena]
MTLLKMSWGKLKLVRRIQCRRLAKRLQRLPSPPADTLPILPKAPTHEPTAQLDHGPLMCFTDQPPEAWLRVVLAEGTKPAAIPAYSHYGPRSPAKFMFSPAPSSPIDWSRQGAAGSVFTIKMSGRDEEEFDPAPEWPAGRLRNWLPDELWVSQVRFKSAELSNLVNEV